MKTSLWTPRIILGLVLAMLISVLSIAQHEFPGKTSDKARSKYRPTIRDMFQMPMVGAGRISPDGDRVIYRLARVDNFKDNQLQVCAYLYDSKTDQTCQLTKAGIVSEVRWINNQTIALLKPVGNTGFQIHIFEGLGGECQQITDHQGGIETFEPFGNGFIYIAERTTKTQVARESKYGSFVNVEEEESLSALYYVDCARILDYRRRLRSSGNEGNQLSKHIVELSELLKRPYKIESVVPFLSEKRRP